LKSEILNLESEINLAEVKDFLEKKYLEYSKPEFIETDPIQVPHLFTKKEDIEISGFLTATISWGQRKSIIKSAKHLMQLMDHAPYDFILNHTKQDLRLFDDFIYRTFNSEDLKYFLVSLKHIYENKDGLEKVFTGEDVKTKIINFKKTFFEHPHPTRTEKHVSNPAKGSAAKRINMFLRWMVRSPKEGIDFGIWKSIQPKELMCPLDVHSGNVARKLNLLKRTQNDWKSAEELTGKLKTFDNNDPVKYDFALFGLGVFEKF
jgi:uncharacterized protein (TIGR02757 family)